jgi:hypothetical protein
MTSQCDVSSSCRLEKGPTPTARRSILTRPTTRSSRWLLQASRCVRPVARSFECIRCDKIAQAGWVHRLMISQIYDAEVAIVDLSTLNPNVFYELGVRHALRRTVTVLLCRKGTKTPFNIAGFNHIPYDPNDAQSLQWVQTQIASFVANGLMTGQRDSLVFEVLEEQGWEGPPPIPLAWEPRRIFRLRNLPDTHIGILTGGLQYIKDIDIWVNSENTNMRWPVSTIVRARQLFAI